MDNLIKLIFTHTPDMLWAKDLTGKYIFANKAICENLLMATDTEEPIGKTDVFFAQRERAKHPENAQWHTFGELCFDSDKETLKSMKTMRFEEYGNIRGELIYLEVHKAPFFDNDGNLLGVIGSGRDITMQKKLERDLQITNHLIESGPVVVFEWSGEEGWPINFVSTNVENVLGLSYDKLINRSAKFADFVHPEDIPNVEQEVKKYLEESATKFVQEYRLIKEDGEVIWIKDYTIVEYDEENSSTIIKGYIFDNTTQKIADDRVQYLYYHDQLTELPNRQKLILDIENHPPKACAIFNIDSFREINDFFGIAIGDKILIDLALEAKKMEINVYRIGGDEFAVLFYEDYTQHTLEEKITQMLLQLHDMTFMVSGEIINVHMNVGAALGSEKILTRADIALHKAKENKLAIGIYKEKENIEEIYKKNINMAAALHKALIEGRVVCYYQPIVDIATHKTVKYEVLVRMIDDQGNIILPLEFLHIAKKTKLYSKITHEVVHQACRYFATRSEEFSINLSIDDINDPYTVQEIITKIIDTGTADRVVFEILETEGIENYASVSRFIKQVKALGAKIAIDDFGTGYSNFEHILQLNVDYIKIDGSLIRTINENSRHRLIVETIVEFSKKIGAKTIAEFVTDEKVYEVVKELGIDYSQGYFTGKPEPKQGIAST
ncbi:EAL domain-containing protein [Sulfuricurvum sp.]|uniref:EAL domain-containing protein n=1 Tax=Sulfuricurvum sp. TaxID=2025608 RepID=UPI003BB02FFE